LTSSSFLDLQDRTSGISKLSASLALLVDDRDFTITSRARPLHPLILTVRRRVNGGTRPLGAILVFLDGTLTDTTDVEGPHRQLRARLADALGSDDADGHTFLDQEPVERSMP
jgi:hypothetical protein